MNAAAKVIHQSSLFHGSIFQLRISGSMFWGLCLTICLFLSALAIIFTINISRMEYSECQQEQQQTHQLQLEWGKLLLEQASLARPARVAQIATHQLAMMHPDARNTVILRTK